MASKKVSELILSEEQMNEVAKFYGPEYGTALQYVSSAIKNGHKEDRAVAYAVSELEKVGIQINPEKLVDAVKNYLVL
jgi:guanylate kinase